MSLTHETVHLDEIRLIGRSIRTANARAHEIGEFRGSVFAEGHFDRIPLPSASPDAIISTWQKIWTSDLEPARAYAADYDRYYTADGEMKAEICLSLR